MSIDLVVAGNLAEDVIFNESHYGGSAGNIALNASLFGLRTGIVSNYGKDTFSTKYVEYLKSRGVQTELLQPGLKSLAQCVVSSNINHSSSKEWIDNGTSTALRDFEPTNHQRKIIEHSRYLHLTTTPASLALKLSGIQRGEGVMGYEPGPRLGDDDTYFDEVVFSRSDFLFVNEEELQILDQMIGVSALKKRMRDKQSIIATLGGDGVELITCSNQKHYSVHAVEEPAIIDSNGAGDAFKSGFYVGLSRTNNIQTAIEYGAILGSHIIQKQGALLEAGAVELPLPTKNITRPLE